MHTHARVAVAWLQPSTSLAQEKKKENKDPRAVRSFQAKKKNKKIKIVWVVCVQKNGDLLRLLFVGKTSRKMSNEIYFLQEQKKIEKQQLSGEDAFLEKHLDGNGTSGSRTRLRPAQENGAIRPVFGQLSQAA